LSTARRRADIKRKKLKTLGKSKSTESEEECEEEEADEGKARLFFFTTVNTVLDFLEGTQGNGVPQLIFRNFSIPYYYYGIIITLNNFWGCSFFFFK
jgi:hypothetical protein